MNSSPPPSESGSHPGFEGIDHVEMFVPSRREAVGWYGEVLGLDALAERKDWALSPGGPLMISNDQGQTMLALFRADGHGIDPAVRVTPSVGAFRWVAFRASGEGFLRFLGRLAVLNLLDTRGEAVTVERVSDHQSAWSIYFADPWGHALEVTTYDYEVVRQGLVKASEKG
ncbi:MAG: VOC family protein [Acidobacteriota bacterium]